MGKPYDKTWYFAGSGTMTGLMRCAGCQNRISSDKEDWLSYKKSAKGDWKYVTWHRVCCSDQSGWEKYEKEWEAGEAEVRAIMKDLSKYLDNSGYFSLYFSEAVDRLIENGLEEQP